MRCTSNVCESPVPRYSVDEDFETGNLSKFPYTFDGNTVTRADWTIERSASACHGGEYCMRTSPLQAPGQTNSVSVALSVREDTTISFWAKTETEAGEHVFRFYVDGVEALKISGQTPWQRYSVPVAATGAGGSDRILRWEYARSGYVNPDRPPLTAVWIDDIDMPAWNTAPSVPRLLEPMSGAVIATSTPELRWRSFDPDFDPIIYQVDYDTDPTFPNPVTTGETFELTFTPPQTLTADRLYFWRARAKDTSDYRWSAWSPTSSFRIVPDDEYQVRWRQDSDADFALDAMSGTRVADGSVRVTELPVTINVSIIQETASQNAKATLTNMPLARPDVDAQLKVRNLNGWGAIGNCGAGQSPTARIYCTVDSASCGVETRLLPLCTCVEWEHTFTIGNFAAQINADRRADITLQHPAIICPPCNGTRFCGNMQAELTYSTVGSGTILSVPIAIDDFGPNRNWEKVHLDVQGTPLIQVLDEREQLIPDSVLPGNSTGLRGGTTFLWHLSAVDYPMIRLKAELRDDQRLHAWEVYANNGYKWHFGNDGDAEGWTAADDGATPTVNVAGGVLRVESTAAGSNPRLVYALPTEIDATRFTELVVKLRTSNNAQNDTVSLYWENNFGSFDKVRSFDVVAFLFTQKDVKFDLTQSATSPQQPWQGRVTGLRVDPVARFLDAAGAPASGFAEIEHIWLR